MFARPVLAVVAFAVAVQDPRRDQNDVVFLDLHSSDHVGGGSRARDQERRRVKTHCFVEHGTRELQLFRRKFTGRCGLEGFPRQFILRGGIERQ